MVISFDHTAHVLGPVWTDCAIAAPAIGIGAGVAVVKALVPSQGNGSDDLHKRAPTTAATPVHSTSTHPPGVTDEANCDGIMVNNGCVSQSYFEQQMMNGQGIPWGMVCSGVTCASLNRLQPNFRQAIAENCRGRLVELGCPGVLEQKQLDEQSPMMSPEVETPASTVDYRLKHVNLGPSAGKTGMMLLVAPDFRELADRRRQVCSFF
eukprot:GEMP01067084.1.p1 GENE.GEMP01067084.1~~GEMP01067084.1.p1  ORF type:complete len:208 (+),score=44.17 GEMP01067084.1:303-926(+)